MMAIKPVNSEIGMECPSVQFVLEREQFSPNVFLFSTELRGLG